MPSHRNPGQSHMRGWIGFLIPPPKGEGGPGGLRPPFLASRTPTRSVGYASAARRVGWGFPHPSSLRSPTLPRFALPYLHISRFRVADSGETLDFWSFPALGDAQGAVWCKSLFRLIFSNLCRYRSRFAGEG